MMDDVTNLEFLAKGKRGEVFTGFLYGIKVAVKIKNPESRAISRIEHEGYWLERLNRHGIGPKLIFYDEDHVVYELVEGPLILDFIDNAGKEEILKALFELIEKMHDLDMLGVDKEEMHRPVKHIFITEEGPRMIDFERCHISVRPKNLTQFCQFISSIKGRLAEKGIMVEVGRMRGLAKDYKLLPSRESVEAIKKYLAGRA